MKRITLIITALNENRNVIKTLQSIYATANPDLFDVVVINDGTFKNKVSKGWIEIPPEYHCKVVHHHLRQGIHVSRSEGVALAETQYIGMFNARMQFEDGWLDKVLYRLDTEPKTLFCTVSKVLNEKWQWDKTDGGTGLRYGCNMLMYYERPDADWHNKNAKIELLPPKWRLEYTTDEIPCVLGAMYFCSKKWFNYIGGLEGLHSYGADEQFLSLKTWMFGGKVKIIKDVHIANVYRPIKTYCDNLEDYFYNTVFIGFVLFDWKTANMQLERIMDSPYYPVIQLRLIRNMDYIMSLRYKYAKLTINDYKSFIN